MAKWYSASCNIALSVLFLYFSVIFATKKRTIYSRTWLVLSFIVVHIAVYFACSRKKEKFTHI